MDRRTDSAEDWDRTYRDMLAHGTDLSEVIFLALGAGSMCWTNPHGAGIFDSTRARLLGDALLDEILRRTGNAS